MPSVNDLNEIKKLLCKKEELLSKYAQKSVNSLGRNKTEEFDDPFRTEFQIDKERIINSKAFRRLKRKTQVFYTPKNDHLRTRLTHTLEVSQISRTLSNILNLNEDARCGSCRPPGCGRPSAAAGCSVPAPAADTRSPCFRLPLCRGAPRRPAFCTARPGAPFRRSPFLIVPPRAVFEHGFSGHSAAGKSSARRTAGCISAA